MVWTVKIICVRFLKKDCHEMKQSFKRLDINVSTCYCLYLLTNFFLLAYTLHMSCQYVLSISNKRACSFIAFGVFALSACTFSLLFFHSPSSLRECSRTCLCQYHPTAQRTMASSRGTVGDFVTPFVLEKLFDYSCFC